MKRILLLFTTILLCEVSIAQTSYVWNGITSTDWGTSTNWTPNGVPGAVDNATIVTGANNCVLAANTTITNLTITSGVLNLNTFTLNTTGVVACNGGSCNNGTFNSTAASLTFAGTTFGADITANVANVFFNGSTFNGSVAVTKNSASNIVSSGNNTFNGVTSITNAGTGYLLLTGTTSKTDVFNGQTTFNTTNTGNLFVGYTGTVNLNNLITFNNPSSSGSIYVGYNGTANLSIGNTLNCGTFSGGSLNLRKFVQSDATPLVLSPGNAGQVNIYNSTITASLTVNAGAVTVQTSTLSSSVTYNIGGTNNNAWSSGGNVYNGVLTINNSSNGYTGFANGTGDIYNADVYANITSTTGGRILFGNNSTSQFNGNVYVSQSGALSSSGIAIGWGGTYPITNFAAGKSVIVNGTFDSGYLQLYKIQQADNTPLNITTTGTAIVRLQQNVFLGNVNISSPDISPEGGTYHAPVVFTKTGGANNHNAGNQNIFNSTVEVNNQNGGGYFMLGYNSNDQFNDNITVTSTGSSSGISFGWSSGSGTPTLASGKTISIGGAGFSAGYLQLGSFTQLGTTPINLTLTGNSSLYVVNANSPCSFGGNFTVTAPDIYIQGGTFNNDATFTKTAGTSNHNNGNQNIFNGTCTINQQSSSGYFMLGYNSTDQFNEDIVVTSTGTGGIRLGHDAGTGTPVLAPGKTVSIGGAGFSAGYLLFGSFTQLGSGVINLNTTGNSTIYVQNANSPCSFGGSFTASAADLYIRGGIFNGATSFTKTGGADNHNNGTQNIFNNTLTINQQSTSGYFMLGYNSNDLFNDDITVTNIGTRAICLGYSSGSGTPTLASGKTVMIGGAGFSGGSLYFGGFTQLGSAPINLNLTGTTTALSFRASTFGGDFTSTSPTYNISSSTFNGIFSATKTGASNDPNTGGNTFNGVTTITNSGAGYFGFGWSSPDTWNGDVTFTNNGSERILPAWVTAGNLFNGNITVNSTGSSVGINFCGNGSPATATLAAGKTINVGTYDKGYLILQRFTQLGNVPVNITLPVGSNYLTIGPNSTIGGDLTVDAQSINNITQSTFNGIVSITKNGNVSDSWTGGNTFNSTSTFINNAGSYLLLGNGNPDVFNGDVTFTSSGSSYIAPSYNSAGNMYNGNITVNSTGGSTAISFGNASASTSTLAATKTIQIGGLGFTSGYLALRQFTQLGNAPINLTLGSTASFIQYGPSSVLGGNVTSVSPRLYFNGCTFNGTANCTKNGAVDDQSAGNNIFNGATTITSSGSGYIMLGNGNADQFNNTATFNNIGSNNMHIAYNSTGNTFGGVTTFSNSPTGNYGIYVSSSSTGTLFNDNIVVSSTAGQGVQFCVNNTTASATLASGKTISIGAAGFSVGTLLLKQFTQLGGTTQTLSQTTGTGALRLGPTSTFNGDVNFNFPQVYLNGTTYNGLATIEKNGATDNAGIGGNIFNGTTVLTNSGSGYLLTGNGTADQFNGVTTMNNTGSYRIFFAHNHSGQTTTFAQPLTLNSNKSGGTDGWSYFVCESNNSHVLFNDLTINIAGTPQSNMRILNGGTNTTATYNGNLVINLSNTNASGTQIQMGGQETAPIMVILH